jgi:arsenate reductase
MNLSFTNKTKHKAKNTALFVCVENAGRSQMAEAFFRKYAPDGYEAVSAGTQHSSQINPVAVTAMGQLGIDISNQKSKEMTEGMIRNATKVVNMGCIDKNFCPALFINKVIDWNIEDPKGKSIEKVAEIRDEIEKRVKGLIERLDKEENSEG